ncbi:hypothetical protein C1645_296319 [Glomus cerebriforme]|uniref:Spo12 family-domain-containing protein n=1 Tax=Glomus cerebriforme TaxID=658196 RepID=A0A397STN2_9GLOM|nr:hypothetical protein C1645_296319 [Glomus cerebriforme]
MSQQSAKAQIGQNLLEINSPANFIEIQEMHVQKSKHSIVFLPPKTTQNFVSPTDRNLSPCTTKLLQAKKTKNYKNCKPVFLSNIFTKALKEDQEKQVKAEASNTESEDIFNKIDF